MFRRAERGKRTIVVPSLATTAPRGADLGRTRRESTTARPARGKESRIGWPARISRRRGAENQGTRIARDAAAERLPAASAALTA